MMELCLLFFLFFLFLGGQLGWNCECSKQNRGDELLPV